MRCMDQTKSHPAMIPSAKTSTVNVGESGSSISAAPANCCSLFYLHNQETVAADKIRPITRIGSDISLGDSLTDDGLLTVSRICKSTNVRETTIGRPMSERANSIPKSEALRPSLVVEQKKLVGVARCCRNDTPPASPSETHTTFLLEFLLHT